ncbi:MAG: 6-pyruvoyl-tetrahydropterin synthase-related protein [Acidimicrobiales bacterium]
MESSTPPPSLGDPQTSNEEEPQPLELVKRSRLKEQRSRLQDKGLLSWMFSPLLSTFSSAEALINALVVVGVMLFIVLTLHPELVVANTTPTGGDMGAHVWGPAFLRDHLLTQGRLSGWAPDWYAGFPLYQFYMVLPALAIVALDVLLPYGVAFKLITMSGIVALPLAAYVFGRLVRLPFPGPALMSIAVTFFLFDKSFTIYGGNIASTMAGEFSFTISLAFALVYLGVLIRGVHTGRHRALAAGLFALVVLCHVIPAVFALVATFIVLLVYGARRSFWFIATMGVVGSALTGFWAVPFLARSGYMTSMAYEKMTHYIERLLPGRIGSTLTVWNGGRHDADIVGDVTIVFVLALVGAGISIFYYHRVGIFLTISAIAFALAYVLLPEARLWNPRLLPFWYLNLYLLAALAVSEAIQSVAILLSDGPNKPKRSALLAGPVLALVLALMVISFPLRVLPFGKVSKTGAYSWMGIESKDQNFVRGWAKWNYSGYERKEAFPEYRDVIGTMKWIGENEGCGRAMWEYESEQNRFGTPMALMLLPYWTDGCIGSMEGLYFESASTTPYHFLNAAELSKAPSNPQRKLPYGTFDVDKGVDHLQMLGVKYYMAFSPSAVAAADQNAELTPVATTGNWHVYEVENADLVEGIGVEPAVIDDIDAAGDDWLYQSVTWYVTPQSWQVPLAGDGPESWQRVNPGKPGKPAESGSPAVKGKPAVPPETPEINKVRTAKVTNIEADTDRISFDVDRPGTPVIVKASYFPNWKASGANGPWRVTPSLMVVVPTSKHVELSYGNTGVDWFGWVLTLAGLVGLVALRRRPLTLAAIDDRDFNEKHPSDDGNEPDEADKPDEALTLSWAGGATDTEAEPS